MASGNTAAAKRSSPSSSSSSVTRETEAASANGYLMFAVSLALVLAGVYFFATAGHGPIGPLQPGKIVAAVLLILLGGFSFRGLYMLQPNQAALLLLFGNYRGTDRNAGLRWANPFCMRTKLSLRANNFNSDKIKVNDKRGNPIEVGAAIVWRVEDTARAQFDVENYKEYVRVQSEAAIRHLANSYAYDEGDEAEHGKEITLRSGIDDVSGTLLRELQERFDQAGIVVEDAKLTHLAYAPEIAGVMLRRQQAEAIIAARQKIVTGAVSMVEMALHALSERKVVELDDERKASMVSNLLVVLCAENEVQPVVNAGTLYG
jgi:regulator of protease activity HflC (stomatin/prohibitin superfamily)